MPLKFNPLTGNLDLVNAATDPTTVLAATIVDADTTHAPDGNSVFDALALKAPLASPSFTTPSLGVASATSLATSGNITMGGIAFAAYGGVTFGSPANIQLASGRALSWSSGAIGSADDTTISREDAGRVRIGTSAANALGKLDCAEYQIAGTKVVGAQGAAVVDATDEASAVTQLNTLLARLRAHGIIAT